MSRILLLLPLLAACDKSVGLPKDTAEPLAELGVPYAAIYAHTAPDYLRTECRIGVELYVEGQATPAAEADIYATGREWIGVQLDTNVQYTAEASWQDCTTVDSTGTGTFSSGAFSGTDGDLFLFRYDGVTGAFEALHQRETFEGGKALVTFVDSATSGDVATTAEEIGVAAELLSTTSKQYEVTWDDTRSVGEILAAFSDDNQYLEGQPVWIEQPEWW